MTIEIHRYKDCHVEAVKDFNRRLEAGGEPSRFPEFSRSILFPKLKGVPLYREFFLAIDGGNVVRGGYQLLYQEFFLNGQPYRVGNYHWPVSEGTVNRAYNVVGVRLLNDALRREPLLSTLGMGGYDQPLARMLKAGRWVLETLPFYFKVVNVSRFLKNIEVLRRSRSRALLADLAHHTGLPWLGIQWLQRRGLRRSTAGLRCEPVAEFGAWADEIWDAARGNYLLIANRDHCYLRAAYPPRLDRLLRLRIFSGSRPAGWAVVLDTAMSGNKFFGRMRVGTIVDCLALPGEEGAVIAAATEYLEERKVDLIVSHESHQTWIDSLRGCGFISGPSNFLVAISPQFAKLAGPLDQALPQSHLNRGDGIGPVPSPLYAG